MKEFILSLLILFTGYISKTERPVHIFMIGDSTMANKSTKAFPETGWGQVLQDFFSDSVKVENHAKNGRSSKSFRDEGLWKEVITNVQKGDYVIIQFGHNDKKPDTARHTDPFTSYKANLVRYINETREKGGIPVLCTPIVRRHFDAGGNLLNTHGDYLEAVRQVVNETGVGFIDMEIKTRGIVETMGPEKSKQLYLFINPGIYPTKPKGCKDATHLSQLGAYTFASLAMKGMKEINLPVIKYLVNK